MADANAIPNANAHAHAHAHATAQWRLDKASTTTSKAAGVLAIISAIFPTIINTDPAVVSTACSAVNSVAKLIVISELWRERKR